MEDAIANKKAIEDWLKQQARNQKDDKNGKQGDKGHAANGSDTSSLAGHSLGNLIIAALQEVNHGNLLHAIEDAQQLLDTPSWRPAR